MKIVLLRLKTFILFLMIIINVVLLTSCKESGAPNIRQEVFGVMPDGDTVTIYTLSNGNDMKVRILNYGGIVQSVEVPDKNGKLSDVVLGFDDLDSYFKDSPYFGALIGRYGNRIAGGKFSLKDSTYTLVKNDGPNSLHGGRKGFDKKIWTASPITTDTSQVLNLQYSSLDGEEGYPGRLDVKVKYTLTQDNALHIDYKAKSDKSTVVNLTNHSYFNLSGEEGTIKEHKLMINASHFLPVDSTLIPRGELKSVKNSPMDFNESTVIGERMDEDYRQLKLGSDGYDHCWVLDTEGDIKNLAAELYDPGTGRKVRVYTTEPGLQFYSGNQLDGSITGKKGYRYQKYGALALETEHFPDSPNQSDFPSTQLEPGQEYHTETIYKFLTE